MLDVTSGADAATLFHEAVDEGCWWEKVAGAAFPPGGAGSVPALERVALGDIYRTEIYLFEVALPVAT